MVDRPWDGAIADVRAYGLVTAYTLNPSQFGNTELPGLAHLFDEIQPGSGKSYWLDYSYKLVYEGRELVPRKIICRFVWRTQTGQPIKIDLSKTKLASQSLTYSADKVGTLIFDNRPAPQVSLDYGSGQATGPVYRSDIEAVLAAVDDCGEDVYIPYDGWDYYYHWRPEHGDYFMLSECEAIEEGYVPYD